MADENVLPIPNLALPQECFVLQQPSLSHLHDSARVALLEGIKADQMAPYYRLVVAANVLPLDQALLDGLEKENTAELERLDKVLKEAEETEGESDIADALRAKASYLTRIGEKEKAVEAQQTALGKTAGLGSRIDIVLTLVRIGIFFGDNQLISANLTKADELVEKGGDWDRRNRLKVYRGLHLLSIRQFKPASALLIDALSTFTATELLSYNDFVSLTVISGALTLNRVDLKKKIIGAPEVMSALPELPTLADTTKTLYDCHYDKFFVALATLEQTHLLPSRLLAPHARFYVREMRILAYAQLLQSYSSLTLESLAHAFGVTVDFVDNELSRFIASGRLHATIDRVHGVVETNRPALKNAQTDTVIRKGDVLLNSIQRLSKVLY
ncbi:PCI-domain-containing protein [Lactarius pseudohatsudake]|nr:PCI-domain-containing protein [Lactarius pseudohatsudake]KAH9071102.1 PCI-domain-containing protein [Lactarius deliciosus]KAH9173562.1 PCI-domain-containing protein [Lactarius sanguifluus]